MAKNYSQVSYGSTGDDVKTLQTLLNQKGYSLDVDGIYGKKTQAAVKDYQGKNSLTVDGIAGTQTWGKLTAEKAQTAPAQQSTAPASQVGYTESDTLKALSGQLQDYSAKAPQDYTFSHSDQWDALIDEILNREDFSYDVNADALYQQYKDQYTAQGKLAMLDTVGQAATKTGGYGNSYAQTAGQQTYQSYLQKLGDVIPELYQLALDRYSREGEELYSRYDMLRDKNADAYAQYRDTVADYDAALSRLLSQYDSQREFEYGQYRDGVEDAQWQTQQDEEKRQFDLSYDLEQAQLAVSRQKASATAAKEGLSVSEYNAIHDKCLVYAEEGQDKLAAYLQGLVEQGSISKELAWQILQSFFPLYEEKQEIYDI